MFKRILIPTDGSELSDRAARQGITLARSLGAEIVGIVVLPEYRSEHAYREFARQTASGYTVSGPSVSDPPPVVENADDYKERAGAIAERFLSAIRSAASEAGVSCRCVHRISDETAEALVEAAAREHCDLIVMGSHGRSGVRRVLGSVTDKVLARTGLPVLVWH